MATLSREQLNNILKLMLENQANDPGSMFVVDGESEIITSEEKGFEKLVESVTNKTDRASREKAVDRLIPDVNKLFGDPDSYTQEMLNDDTAKSTLSALVKNIESAVRARAVKELKLTKDEAKNMRVVYDLQSKNMAVVSPAGEVKVYDISSNMDEIDKKVRKIIDEASKQDKEIISYYQRVDTYLAEQEQIFKDDLQKTLAKADEISKKQDSAYNERKKLLDEAISKVENPGAVFAQTTTLQNEQQIKKLRKEIKALRDELNYDKTLPIGPMLPLFAEEAMSPEDREKKLNEMFKKIEEKNELLKSVGNTAVMTRTITEQALAFGDALTAGQLTKRVEAAVDNLKNGTRWERIAQKYAGGEGELKKIIDDKKKLLDDNKKKQKKLKEAWEEFKKRQKIQNKDDVAKMLDQRINGVVGDWKSVLTMGFSGTKGLKKEIEETMADQSKAMKDTELQSLDMVSDPEQDGVELKSSEEIALARETAILAEQLRLQRLGKKLEGEVEYSAETKALAERQTKILEKLAEMGAEGSTPSMPTPSDSSMSRSSSKESLSSESDVEGEAHNLSDPSTSIRDSEEESLASTDSSPFEEVSAELAQVQATKVVLKKWESAAKPMGRTVPWSKKYGVNHFTKIKKDIEDSPGDPSSKSRELEACNFLINQAAILRGTEATNDENDFISVEQLQNLKSELEKEERGLAKKMEEEKKEEEQRIAEEKRIAEKVRIDENLKGFLQIPNQNELARTQSERARTQSEPSRDDTIGSSEDKETSINELKEWRKAELQREYQEVTSELAYSMEQDEALYEEIASTFTDMEQSRAAAEKSVTARNQLKVIAELELMSPIMQQVKGETTVGHSSEYHTKLSTLCQQMEIAEPQSELPQDMVKAFNKARSTFLANVNGDATLKAALSGSIDSKDVDNIQSLAKSAQIVTASEVTTRSIKREEAELIADAAMRQLLTDASELGINLHKLTRNNGDNELFKKLKEQGVFDKETAGLVEKGELDFSAKALQDRRFWHNCAEPVVSVCIKLLNAIIKWINTTFKKEIKEFSEYGTYRVITASDIAKVAGIKAGDSPIEGDLRVDAFNTLRERASRVEAMQRALSLPKEQFMPELFTDLTRIFTDITDEAVAEATAGYRKALVTGEGLASKLDQDGNQKGLKGLQTSVRNMLYNAQFARSVSRFRGLIEELQKQVQDQHLTREQELAVAQKFQDTVTMNYLRTVPLDDGRTLADVFSPTEGSGLVADQAIAMVKSLGDNDIGRNIPKAGILDMLGQLRATEELMQAQTGSMDYTELDKHISDLEAGIERTKASLGSIHKKGQEAQSLQAIDEAIAEAQEFAKTDGLTILSDTLGDKTIDQRVKEESSKLSRMGKLNWNTTMNQRGVIIKRILDTANATLEQDGHERDPYTEKDLMFVDELLQLEALKEEVHQDTTPQFAKTDAAVESKKLQQEVKALYQLTRNAFPGLEKMFDPTKLQKEHNGTTMKVELLGDGDGISMPTRMIPEYVAALKKADPGKAYRDAESAVKAASEKLKASNEKLKELAGKGEAANEALDAAQAALAEAVGRSTEEEVRSPLHSDQQEPDAPDTKKVESDEVKKAQADVKTAEKNVISAQSDYDAQDKVVQQERGELANAQTALNQFKETVEAIGQYDEAMATIQEGLGARVKQAVSGRKELAQRQAVKDKRTAKADGLIKKLKDVPNPKPPVSGSGPADDATPEPKRGMDEDPKGPASKSQ